MKKLNTVQETAKILGITKTSVYALITSGVLEKVDAGAKEYITPASLNKLLIGDTEKNNMAEHGYPLSEEVGLMLPNGKGNNSMDGDEMEYSGNISKLSDGRYMVQINLGTDENGKRKRYSKSFRDMTSAQIHLGEKLNELNHPKDTILLGGGDEEHDKTVALIREAIRKEYEEKERAKYTNLNFEQYSLKILAEGIGKANSRTMEGYRRGLAVVNPYLGSMQMTQITTADVKKVFNELAKKYVDSNLQRASCITTIVFRTAYEREEIPKDILRGFKRPLSLKVTPMKKPYFTDDEIRLIFEKSKAYSFRLYTMFVVLECTGMRPAEMRALEWNAIDLDQKKVYIHQAISREFEEITDIKKASRSKEFVSTTKNKKNRCLILSALAVETLREWKKCCAVNNNEKIRNSKFVFPNPEGQWLEESGLHSCVQRFRAKYGLDSDVHFYKFRHTMCTRLALAKYSTAVAKAILGDNDDAVINDVYTHIQDIEAQEIAKDFYVSLDNIHQSYGQQEGINSLFTNNVNK